MLLTNKMSLLMSVRPRMYLTVRKLIPYFAAKINAPYNQGRTMAEWQETISQSSLLSPVFGSRSRTVHFSFYLGIVVIRHLD